MALVLSACVLALVVSALPHRVRAAGTPMEEAREALLESDYPKALERYKGLLEDAKRSGDTRTMVDCLIELGNVYRNLGHYGRALEHLENALELSMELKYHGRSARALTVAGRVYLDLGQYDEALGHHRRALSIRRNINNTKVGDDFLSIGMVHRYLGQYPKAIEHLENAIGAYRRDKLRRNEATALSEIGTVYRLMGQPERALTYHEQALAISKELKYRLQEQYDLLNMGIAYLALGQPPKALQYFEQALVIGREIQNRKGEGVSLLNIGDALNRMKEYDKARDAASRCLEIFEELGAEEFIWRAEHFLGLINAKQERHEEAMGRSGAKHFAWLPRNMRDKESEIEEELAECERSLAEERSSPLSEIKKGEY